MDFAMDPVGMHSPPLQIANAMTTVTIKMCPKCVDCTHQTAWSASAQTDRVTEDNHQPDETVIRDLQRDLTQSWSQSERKYKSVKTLNRREGGAYVFFQSTDTE